MGASRILLILPRPPPLTSRPRTVRIAGPAIYIRAVKDSTLGVPFCLIGRPVLYKDCSDHALQSSARAAYSDLYVHSCV